MSKITIKNANIFYKDDYKTILTVRSLIISSGINFVIGNNGTGKTTFLKSLSNSFPEIGFDGKLEMDGQPFKRGKVGLVNQSPINSISPNLTFLENMLMAKFSKSDFLKPQIMISKRATMEVLDFLNFFVIKKKVEGLLDKEASKLSAGQQQLLAILMRLFRFNEVLLLDEATANLDAINTKLIIGILLKVAKKGTIIIFATHQRSLLETRGSKIYNTKCGNIIEQKLKIIV